MKTLPNVTDGVHHGIVEGIPAGSRYGFRSSPEHEALPLSMPATNFDAVGEQPLLMDPYGRAVDEREGLITSVRVGNDFDWGLDRSPRSRGATRSSTRPTSGARRSCTRIFRRNCRGRTPGWPTRP